MEKKTLRELDDTNNWEKAIVVFKKESFNKPYSEKARSYEISSDAKYFNPEMNGNSLFGYCLDGSDQGVRLDQYLHDGWIVDYCYIID